MMKKREIILIVIIILLIILVIIISFNKNLIGKAISDINKETFLYFKDNPTECVLNGEVYINNNLIGVSNNGSLKIDKDLIDTSNATDLMIKGNLDSCFGNDFNLPFVEFWKIDNLDLFTYNSIYFKTNLTPRDPRYYEEMQGFVRPEESTQELNNLNLKSNNKIEDLNKIAEYRISYVTDYNLFNATDYWQIPSETITRKKGDCEDWATTTLSMIKAYDPDIKCYDVLWKTHISIFCYLENSYIIYDQDKTKYKRTLRSEYNEAENKEFLRLVRDDYQEEFGIPVNERKVYAVFNDKELVTFQNDEEFISWAYNLSKG
jgi:hypothetical protein